MRKMADVVIRVMSLVAGLVGMLHGLLTGNITVALIAGVLLLVSTPLWFDWRRERSAKRLDKLHARAAFVVSELRHLKQVMRNLPQVMRVEDLRALALEHDDARAFLKAYHLHEGIFSKSPLAEWLRESAVIGTAVSPDSRDGWWRSTRPSNQWGSTEANLWAALVRQHGEWKSEHKRLVELLSKLQDEINTCSNADGIVPRQYFFDAVGAENDLPKVRIEPPVESKRDKLARLRDETEKLKEEILAEEQESAPGPHRRAAGIPERD